LAKVQHVVQVFHVGSSVLIIVLYAETPVSDFVVFKVLACLDNSSMVNTSDCHVHQHFKPGDFLS
jgi:hypothetical protein